MERTQRVAAYWAYLPAFRVVAECEHLPTAARLLRVSPSALSRSIRLLEHRLGVTLFERRDQRLQLSTAGKAFLSATRDALRLIDDGATAALGGSPLSGTLRLSLSAELDESVGTILTHLLRALPDVEPLVHPVADADVAAALLTGIIDIALVEQPPSHVRLQVTAGATFARAAVVGAVRGGLDRDTTPFPVVAVAGRHRDGWPSGFERRVVAEAPSVHAALSLVQQAPCGVVACAAEARGLIGRGLLRTLELSLAPLTLSIVTRKPAGAVNPPAVSAAVDVLRRVLAELVQPQP